MLAKCTSCLRALGWKLGSHGIPKWQVHLQGFCSARAQKQPWCDMFLDNLEIISQYTLPKETEHLIRNTNIASQIVKIITSYYEEQSNLFLFCVELFGSYLKLKYSETINPSKNTLSRIAQQYQDFTKLLINLFVLYFGLQDRQIVGEQTFYKSTLPALASHFVFENLDVQTTVIRTAKLALKNHIDKIQFQIPRFLNSPISDYSLREELQLNQATLQYYNISNGKVQERLYSGAIQIIKQIVRVHSPAEKMKLFEGLPKQIESSIIQFYKKNNIKLDKIEIDQQNLTSLILYLMVQANIPNFFAHLQIAILFSPSSRADSIIEAFLNACQILENGSIIYKEVPDLLSESSQISMRKGSGGPVFFDQVTNVDL